MLKVLVVDDDKLARRGIIAEMPWAAYQMEVVGEANNGEAALEFMRAQPVDVLITDLAMPVMSGLDLIREVRRQYPHVLSVVLTFHQDFELVQEALRLGAIDYIAKIQIEDERMEDVLGGIRRRIAERSASIAHTLAAAAPVKQGAWDAWLVLLAMGQRGDPGELRQVAAVVGQRVQHGQEISPGIWAVPIEGNTNYAQAIEQQLRGTSLHSTWMIITVTEAQTVQPDELSNLLFNYRNQSSFYDCLPGQFVYQYPLERLKASSTGWNEEEASRNREAWSSLLWTVQMDVRQNLLGVIEMARPTVGQLESMFYVARASWERVVPAHALDGLAMPDNGAIWFQWRNWIEEAAERIRSCIHKAEYSEEITQSVMKAIDYIHQHLAIEIRHSELARTVNMSKSYFSLCFKSIVGRSFQDYIRDVRIERAKLLLEQTSYTIAKVADESGYPNEKYFSRVFLKQIGQLPSEYRQVLRTGRK